MNTHLIHQAYTLLDSLLDIHRRMTDPDAEDPYNDYYLEQVEEMIGMAEQRLQRRAHPELTDARARLTGVLRKLRAATDEDDIAYYRHVAREWRKYIKGLEEKHGRETTLQSLNQPRELPAGGD